jgi:hypothetical protein
MAGGLGGVPFTPTEVNLFEKGRPSPSTGVASLRPYIEPGVEGAQPPPRGFGVCAPKIKKKGRVANLCNPAISGTQNPGEPKAHEGGQTGVQGGASPRPNPLTPFPAREGGKFWREVGGEVNPATGGDPKRRQTLSPRGGQMGIQRGETPWL